MKPADRIPGARRVSRYLTMRDGVRIAIDAWIPAGGRPRAPVPTILHQTRYFRNVGLRSPFDRPGPLWEVFDAILPTRRRFLQAGYAWVDVCVRGSGASFGTRAYPWTAAEIADGAEVVDWVLAQPWSNRRVGATGISYNGTSAELLLVNQHPAVRAVAPRFSLFDVYTDVAFPGGIHLAWFTRSWGRFNAMLDAGRLDRATAQLLRLSGRGWYQARDRRRRHRLLGRAVDTPATDALVAAVVAIAAQGVAHVDSDRGRAAVRAASRAHQRNYDVHAGALSTTYRDDARIAPAEPDATVDSFSPHAHLARIEGSGAAILGVSGWLDGAYQRSALHRFRSVSTPGSRVVIGGWDHGGGQDISPFSPAYASSHDHDAELLAFFDAHLRDEPRPDPAAPVRYFTLGEERWKEAGSWPPPGFEPQPWYLGRTQTLRPDAGGAVDGSDPYRVDRRVGTGDRSRWNTLMGTRGPVGYGDLRRWCDRTLHYTSPPLDRSLEVTGSPVAHLWLSSSAPDATVFAYLLDVAPSGQVRYVTEGQLRALHRRVDPGWRPYDAVGPPRSFRRADGRPLVPGEPVELAFDLLPISWRFGAGHRIRLAIAGVDRDHFAVVTPEPTSYRLHRGRARPSRIELPVPAGRA